MPKATTFIFTHDKLTPIVGEPDHGTLQQLKREIYANAYSNVSTLGGGGRGYLGMLMPPVEYANKQELAGQPNEPFMFPARPPADTNEYELHEYEQIKLDYYAMENSLRKQLVEAIEDEYIKVFKDDDVEYGEVKPSTMLAHLIATYGKITQAAVAENIEKLKLPWDASESIQKLWSRINTIQKFAQAAGQPIGDPAIIHATLELIKQTGVFTTNIAMWQNTPEENWTMVAFKAFFDNADKFRDKTTTKQAGYHTAQNVTGTNKLKPDKKSPGGASTANGQTVGGTANGQTEITLDENHPDYGTVILVDKVTAVYYCHSHGGTTNPNHLSRNCTRPKEGHVPNATWRNLQGGCMNLNCFKQNRIYNQENYKQRTAARANATIATDDNTN
jgi:hypothetical protein